MLNKHHLEDTLKKCNRKKTHVKKYISSKYDCSVPSALRHTVPPLVWSGVSLIRFRKDSIRFVSELESWIRLKSLWTLISIFFTVHYVVKISSNQCRWILNQICLTMGLPLGTRLEFNKEIVWLFPFQRNCLDISLLDSERTREFICLLALLLLHGWSDLVARVRMENFVSSSCKRIP